MDHRNYEFGVLTLDIAAAFLYSKLSGGATPSSGNDRLLEACI